MSYAKWGSLVFKDCKLLLFSTWNHYIIQVHDEVYTYKKEQWSYVIKIELLNEIHLLFTILTNTWKNIL
jgi:hypothetical protein